MLTVHHLGVSQSERIVWLCEELEIPYELKRYDREASGMAPPEYKALHPLGAAPVITDGDLVLAESAAIMEYIIAKHGGGRLAVAPDQPGYADYLYWFHFGNGTFMPAQLTLLFQRMLSGGDGGADFAEARAERLWRFVDDRLGQAPYLAGEAFTAADVMMGFPLTRLRAFLPRDLALYPHIAAYLQRIGERPAFRRAMEKGDPQMPPLLT
jgi:glutathione S-transferase